MVTLIGSPIHCYGSERHEHHGHQEHEDDSPHELKGPNGGTLLLDGDIELELAIFENGVPPEYRAWILRDGHPVNDPKLTVTLVRLGGQKDKFTFHRVNDYWLGDGTVSEPHSFDVEVELHVEGKHYHWQWDSHEGRVEISEKMAHKAGIKAEIAGPGRLERKIPVYGRVIIPSYATTQLRARFPGIIEQVNVTVGERVSKGDTLAVIESNESLRSYNLLAPINGVIQVRSVNKGEMTSNAALFTLTDDKTLWAEFKIFPGQRAQIKPSQNVYIEHNNYNQQSQIKHITATLEGKPYVLARAELNNANGDIAPGDLVQGWLDLGKIEVPLMIDNLAIQEINDWKVVFIKVGDTYEVRPLVLGRSDDRYTEVLDGLNDGDQYVVENSYLIKADIEKSGAAHNH